MRFINFIGILLGLLCALGNHLSRFETVAYFQPWILTMICALSLVSLLRHQWISSSFLLCLLAYHSFAMAPFIRFDFLEQAKNEDAPAQYSHFRVLQFNINADNPRHDDLAQAVEEIDADIMVICEANNHLLTRLKHLHNTYPYRIEVARWPNHTLFAVSGTVIWSRFPFQKSETIEIKDGKINAAHAIAEIGNQTVSIYAAHQFAPHNKIHTKFRNEGILELASLIEADPHPNAMLIGDLNQTLWAPSTRSLLQKTQFKSILNGRPFMSTWPSSTYPLGVAIDHIFYRGNLTCTGTGSLEGIGSDHRMLIAEFRYPVK